MFLGFVDILWLIDDDDDDDDDAIYMEVMVK
jgi:hypothetical protein